MTVEQQEESPRPLEILTRGAETDGEVVRLEATAHPAEGEGDLDHERWAVDLVDEHVNPGIEETFEVLEGRYRVVYDDTDQTLEPGEEITVPGSRPHRHWNPADEPTRFRYEARPGRRMDEVLESAFVLAQAGRTDDEGLPGMLQFAVMQRAYPDHFYDADLPVGVQKALFAVLAPVGRLAGYEPRYTREEIAELQ